MYSILLTFVGSHDPYNPDKSNGPILSYVNYFSDRGFHKIYLFYESSEYLARGHELSNIVKKKFPNTNFHFVHVDVSSPTDYEDLFKEIAKNVSKYNGPQKLDKVLR